MQEALSANNLVADIQGALTVGVVTEFLELWDLIAQVIATGSVIHSLL
jgi:hypothetical protein